LKPSVFRVEPGGVPSSVRLPTSKSYANRVLILASINPKPVIIRDLPRSTDVLTMIELLRTIGLKIDFLSESEICIHNSFPDCEPRNAEPLDLKTGDGGTTNRFLAALLCHGRRRYRLHPAERMSERPMDEFSRIARACQVFVAEKSAQAWLEIQGPIETTKKLEIDASKTTQVATGFALAMAKFGTEVTPTGMDSSEDYWKMTEVLIQQHSSNEFTVPVDFSSASYPIALALFTNPACFPQIHEIDPYQADAKLINLLINHGAKIEFTKIGLQVSPSEIAGFDVDCRDFPDLAPTLSFVASRSTSPSRIRSCEILRFKETDRLEEIQKLLSLFGVTYKLEKNDLVIFPALPMNKSQSYQAPSDHRLIMACYLFMRASMGGEIFNYLHASKSFPDFFDIMS
jgi:3-phosphoshikimate 1-carboxyvinyltransferase